MNSYNEESNIANALASVASWCDEIIVVDMHSQDATVEIAQGFGAKISYHKHTGFSEPARKQALSEASGDWILVLDADEVIPRSLSIRLKEIAEQDEADLVYIPKRNYFLGEALRGTFVGYKNDKHARFFKKDTLELTERIHTWFSPKKGTRKMTLPFEAETSMYHYGYLDLSHFAEKIERYTTIEAQQAFERNEKASYVKAWKDALGEFWGQFVKHQGFRDGWRGFYYSAFMAYYYVAKCGKLETLYKLGDAKVIKQHYQQEIDDLLAAYPKKETPES